MEVRLRDDLASLTPYDPDMREVEVMLSANENSYGLPEEVRAAMAARLAEVPAHRYPEAVSPRLRALLGDLRGVPARNVVVGNGGDELLFNLALAWGGPGRTFLNLPPTFSVYDANARLTNTSVVDVPRRADFSIDEEAVLARVAEGGIDYLVVTSPNNPTGQLASETFILRLLDATDALVMVDEAYFEFSRQTMRPYLAQHKNLVILRTFSKAFSLAGARMGYILGDAEVVREFVKVRQPYSVDAVSQAVARVVYANRAKFERGILAVIEERARLIEGLKRIPGVKPFPSDANYVLFRVENAPVIWEALYERGVLVRDFSRAAHLENCLRVTVGASEENDAFLRALRDAVMGKCDLKVPST